jgi:hypothetical protein
MSCLTWYSGMGILMKMIWNKFKCLLLDHKYNLEALAHIGYKHGLLLYRVEERCVRCNKLKVTINEANSFAEITEAWDKLKEK